MYLFPTITIVDGINVNVNEDCCLSAHNVDDEENDYIWNEHDDRLDEMYTGVTALDMIINNKSSKKIYKAVAKEWGITCQMSEQCRCVDCQSNYFTSEYDEVHNRQNQKQPKNKNWI